LDYVEEHAGRLTAYEFKWGQGEIKKSTREAFLGAYANSELKTINKENFEDFLLES
jgi:hypothetical protein